jgi:3-ketosteroid 9alpha-monooxygenase subunit A
MVDRFEFELDTAPPHAAWMKEVEANLAAAHGANAGSP